MDEKLMELLERAVVALERLAGVEPPEFDPAGPAGCAYEEEV